ncbi:MAG TPA: glycosyltransferase family 9 protein [Terriglobales bacterium]|nr:glycosyltransferase family 9 protein [Terriglobales bacterium]
MQPAAPFLEQESGAEAHIARGGECASASGKRIQRILIVRLGSMGDIIHTLPAISLLRRLFPGASLGWVIEARWAELLVSRGEFYGASAVRPEKPLVEAVHVVDTAAWRKSLLAADTRDRLRAVLRQVRGEHYDLAIDFQSAIRSAAAAMLSGAPQRFGFSRAIETPASLFYTRRFEWSGTHVVAQNASLAIESARAVNASGSGNVLPREHGFELPRDARQDAWASDELARRGVGSFVLMNPGAGWGAKCWPAERFAAVARALRMHGLTSLVNHGPGEEALAAAVAEQSGGAAQTLACGIGQLIALTRRARLCVGGDTGPTHLAAALGVPVVGIYGPTDPARNGPYGSASIVLRSPESVTSHARRADPELGMLQIQAEDVIAAARQLLASARMERR